MNDQAIQDSYDLFTQGGYTKSIDEFKKLISSNPNALQDSYDLFTQGGYTKSIDDYKTLMGIGSIDQSTLKKKEDTQSLASDQAQSQSQQQQIQNLPITGVAEPGIAKSDTTVLPSAPSSSALPSEPVAKTTQISPIEQAAQATLPQAGVETPIVTQLTKVAEVTPILVEQPKETPFFTGAVGGVLAAMDTMAPFKLGDFIDDIGRAISSGSKQGAAVTPSNELMVMGKGASPELIKKYVEASKEMNNVGASDEMMNFSKVYQEEGKGIYGFLKGIVQNPDVLPEIAISSMASLLNPSSIAAMGTTVGAAAGGGALIGGVGAFPATLASIPYAMGAANVVLETGLTFGELLNNELQNRKLDFTEENVKKILEDDKALSSIRAKSVARGATIGMIDAFTGRLAGKVGAKLITNTVESKIKGGLAATGIEMAGGSVGETAGRIVAGQPMDVAEIGFEAVAEGPMAIPSLVSEVLKKPLFKVNGEIVNENAVKDLIANTPASDLGNIDFEFKNDKAGYKEIIQDKVVTHSIREQVKQANPDLNNASLDAITQLEKDLQKVEGNKTQTGKDKAAAIRTQIKNIQENQIQEEAIITAVEAEKTPEEVQTLTPKENAIQKPSTDESLLGSKQPTVELQEMGKGNAQPQGPTTRTQETIPAEKPQEVRTPEQTVKALEKLPTEDKKGITFTDSKGTEVSLEGNEKTLADLYNEVKDIPETDRTDAQESVIDAHDVALSDVGMTAPTEVQAEVATTEVQAETTQDLLMLDTKDKTNLKRVYDHLDALDKKLDQFGKETLGMNIPVVLAKAVVKSLKAFVNAGMTLEAAIRKAAQTHKIKEDDVLTALDTVSKINENKLEGVSEFELPGYNRMIKEVTETIIPKNQKRGVPYAKGINNVIEYVMTSKAYENATDVQREQIIRDVRKMFDLKEKTAPSIKKILGAEKPKMVTVNDKTALADQIKLEVNAARDAKVDLNTKRRMLNRAIKDMVNVGKITVRQAKTLINKVSTVNLDNDAAVNQIVEYADKVFNKAENKSKVEDGIKLKKQISKLSRNKEKNVDLTNLGKAFAKIDPSMVDDIDAYNEMASQIHESIKGSTIRGTNVNSVEMVNISEAYDYTNKAIEAQNEKIKEKLAADLQEVMGMDAGDLTIDQMIDLLKSDKPIPADNEKKIRAKISRLFDTYSAIIKDSIATGIDSITGEDVSYTKEQEKIIKDFMSMDVNKFTDPKDALSALDALKNFLQNKSTAKMDDVFSRYTGEQNVKELVKQGVKSENLKLYGLGSIGRLFAEQFTALPLVFERMFKGFKKGGIVEDAIGLTKLKNAKAKSETEVKNVVKDYVEKFYKKIANGEKFNTLYNNVERGIASFVFRSKMGTEAEMQKEFETRKNLVQESIDALSKGTDKEKIKAEQYQKVYDKILKDSNNREEVKGKVDKTNLEAIDYWTQVWAERYDQIADVSLNTYNTILEKDFNYNPDKYIKLQGEVPDVQLTSDKSAFHTNSGLYKEKSSGLMEAQVPNNLPKSRVLDFSFDHNNSNSLYDVLVDINTASAIRQVESAINSDSFKQVVEKSEDRTLLKERINLYVDNIRRKRIVDSDELSDAVKKLNSLARVGAGMALADPLQVVKQFIPVMFGTLANAGTFNVAAFTDLNKMKFIDESGYAIANRGVESQAQVESINKLIEKATDSNDPKKALEYIRQASDMWLKIFLVKPDVAIARASWLAYYEKSLKEQGIDPSTVDYTSHELNEKAANYAQRSIDRQQNISDVDLQGKIFSSTDPVRKSVISSLMPFASFRMNQTMRMMSDVINLTSKSDVVSKEDKAIAARSLAGFGVEMATFKAIAGVSSFFLGSIALSMMGKDEDDEARKKRWANTWKGQLTGTVSDVFSPLPLLDNLVTYGVGTAQDILKVDEDSSFRIYKDSAIKTIAKSLGMYGIALDKASQVAELISIAESGKYKDDFGREKYITTEDQGNLKALIIPSILISSGITPIGPSGSTIIRNAVKFAKKESSTLAPEVKSEKDRVSMENKEKYLEKVEVEANVLDKLIARESNSQVRQAMIDKKDDLQMTSEEKKDQKEEIKQEREAKKQKMEELLGGYDNQGDMKKYKPALWLKKFGPNSPYGKEHKYELKAEEKFRKKVTELKDRAHHYTKKTRSSMGTR